MVWGPRSRLARMECVRGKDIVRVLFDPRPHHRPLVPSLLLCLNNFVIISMEVVLCQPMLVPALKNCPYLLCTKHRPNPPSAWRAVMPVPFCSQEKVSVKNKYVLSSFKEKRKRKGVSLLFRRTEGPSVAWTLPTPVDTGDTGHQSSGFGVELETFSVASPAARISPGAAPWMGNPPPFTPSVR